MLGCLLLCSRSLLCKPHSYPTNWPERLLSGLLLWLIFWCLVLYVLPKYHQSSRSLPCHSSLSSRTPHSYVQTPNPLTVWSTWSRDVSRRGAQHLKALCVFTAEYQWTPLITPEFSFAPGTHHFCDNIYSFPCTFWHFSLSYSNFSQYFNTSAGSTSWKSSFLWFLSHSDLL